MARLAFNERMRRRDSVTRAGKILRLARLLIFCQYGNKHVTNTKDAR